MKGIALVISLVLSGCVAAEYHPTAQTPYSAIAANRSCAHSFDDLNRTYTGLGSFGLIGAAVGLAAETSSPQWASAQQTYDTCMLGFGWARN